MHAFHSRPIKSGCQEGEPRHLNIRKRLKTTLLLLSLLKQQLSHTEWPLHMRLSNRNVSHVWLFATSWTTAHQAPPSMGFSRQEYWSGVPSPSLNRNVCVCVCVCSVILVVSDSLQPHGRQPTRLLCPWGFPGKHTRVGCHSLLLGIFLTQGLNLTLLCLLHCRQILYCWATGKAPIRTSAGYLLFFFLQHYGSFHTAKLK